MKRATVATVPCTCPECQEPISVGDLIVFWGWGKTGARHLRCVGE